MTYDDFKTTCKDAGLKIVEYQPVFAPEAFIDTGEDYGIYDTLIARYYEGKECADLHTLGKGWQTIISAEELKDKIKESVSSYIYWKKLEKINGIKKAGEDYDV